MSQETSSGLVDADIAPYANFSLCFNFQRNCRFILPFDFRVLEDISPSEYICKYNVISSRREALYHAVFIRHKNNENLITFKNFPNAIKDVSVYEVGPEKISLILNISQIKEGSNFNVDLFKGVCALADRLIFSKMVQEDERAVDQKEGVEKADFHSLKQKLFGINISQALYELLTLL